MILQRRRCVVAQLQLSVWMLIAPLGCSARIPVMTGGAKTPTAGEARKRARKSAAKTPSLEDLRTSARKKSSPRKSSPRKSGAKSA